MINLYKREGFISNPDVLILVEHIVRELEVAVLLKVALEKEGITVIIDTTNYNKERLPFIYNPKLVFLPWAYSEREMRTFSLFKSQNGNKSVLVNFHHEQITNKDSEGFIIPVGRAKNIYHLCWGEEFSELLLKNGCSESLLLNFGSPRQDFYLPKLRGISRDRESLSREFKLNIDNKWLLFAGNSFHLQTEKQKKLYKNIGVDVDGIGKVGAENTLIFLNYVDKLLTENSGYEVIYRPHPSMVECEMQLEQHQKLLNKHKNYHVIFHGAIRDWIINSDCIISYHSTSYVDAFFAKKAFATFRVSKLPLDKDYDSFKNYVGEINDYSVFKEFISSCAFEKYHVKKELITKQFFNASGSYSYLLLVGFVKEKLTNKVQSKEGQRGLLIDRFINAAIFFMKMIANYAASKVMFIEQLLLKSDEQKVRNLVWNKGKDAINESDIRVVEAALREKIEIFDGK